LISIRKAATELDRLLELQRATAGCYALGIRSTAQYAIEIEASSADEYRRHLDLLQERLRTATEPGDFHAVQAAFRGELRNYGDDVQRMIAQLRKKVESATGALQALADSVTASGTEHETQVKIQLAELEVASRIEDLDGIRSGIRTAAAAITASVEQIQRENRVSIAQLCDEIRMLHQEIDAERRVHYTDPASGAWNRQRISARIDDLFRLHEPFCLLVVRLKNFARLPGTQSPILMERALKAFMQRLRNIVGEGVMIGRWSEDEFLAILDMDTSGAITLSREAARELSGPYTAQEAGASQNISLQADTGVIDSRGGTDRDSFYQKLTQLNEALAKA
jgi:GGDEF domain-containing protein